MSFIPIFKILQIVFQIFWISQMISKLVFEMNEWMKLSRKNVQNDIGKCTGDADGSDHRIAATAEEDPEPAEAFIVGGGTGEPFAGISGA